MVSNLTKNKGKSTPRSRKSKINGEDVVNVSDSRRNGSNIASTDKSRSRSPNSKAKALHSLDLEEMLAEYEALREEIGGDDLERLYDEWERRWYKPQDFKTPVPADSLEASIGYSSLFRQMHAEFDYKVAYYVSVEGGALAAKDARQKAFHECTNHEEALRQLNLLVRSHIGSLSFSDLLSLQQFAPRAAEILWERFKREGEKEFQSGHLGANISFPADYQNRLWNIARYHGVRDSFIADWKPKGGVELSLIDMLAQTYFQWQYWLEQAVKRSTTTPNEDHPNYLEWKTLRLRTKETNGMPGSWISPTLDEAACLDQAVQLADRWQRMYMRALRQLRDLRRYAPVLINNAEQVNIAGEGGQQVNVSNNRDGKTKNISS